MDFLPRPTLYVNVRHYPNLPARVVGNNKKIRHINTICQSKTPPKLEPEIIYATDPKNSEELYQMAVKDFIDSSAKWLLTIAHQNQLDFYTTEIFTRLNINTDKKFIFFDSGHKLIDDWKSMKSTNNAPIVVLETDHTKAAKTLLTKTTYYLPDVRNRISAVIMIPMIYPGNQRARVYNQFLGSMLSGEIQSNIPSLNSKELEVFKWHMKDWPTMEYEVENQVIEKERSIVAVMDSDAAIFLCGNDKIAKGVRMALDKIQAKIKPHRGWKAKPILVGFDGSSQNRKYFEKSGYTLLTANIKLTMMCEDVTKLVRGKRSFPEDNNKISSTAIVEPIM